MPQVKGGDASSLRKLINHVSSHMNAIQALALNVPFQDLMLNHLMTANLDNETHQQWEQVIATREDMPTTSELITFLEARCRALELLQNMKTVTAPPQEQPSAGNKVSKPSYCNVATPTQCTMYNKSHSLYECEEFHKLQPRQRFNYVKRQGLCVNCLQPFDKNHACSTQQCRICHKRHHTVLHIHKPTQAVGNNSSTNNSPPALAQGTSNTEVNTYHTLKGKSKTHVLLATAIV
jgi:hypothetical protein